MENISCHSNQSSNWTGIKSIIYVKAYVISMNSEFQLHPPYGFLEDFIQKFTLDVAPATNQIKRFDQKSYETWRTSQLTFL